MKEYYCGLLHVVFESEISLLLVLYLFTFYVFLIKRFVNGDICLIIRFFFSGYAIFQPERQEKRCKKGQVISIHLFDFKTRIIQKLL